VKTELGPDAPASDGFSSTPSSTAAASTAPRSSAPSRTGSCLRHPVGARASPRWRPWAGRCGVPDITVNPTKLAAYKRPLEAVITAVRRGNNDVGGRLVELSGRETWCGPGLREVVGDLEQLVLSRGGHAHPGEGRRPGLARPEMAGGWPTSTVRATWWRHRGHAPGENALNRHRRDEASCRS